MRAAPREGAAPAVEGAETAVWDPEGLLPPIGSTTGGHFERRAAQRAARLAAAEAEASQLGILGNADATREAIFQPNLAPQEGFTPTSAISDSSLRYAATDLEIIDVCATCCFKQVVSEHCSVAGSLLHWHVRMLAFNLQKTWSGTRK